MLVRCHEHPSGSDYRHSVEPVGYPNTAAICGRLGCENPGKILFKEAEWKSYQAGERCIAGPNAFTKIRASEIVSTL